MKNNLINEKKELLDTNISIQLEIGDENENEEKEDDNYKIERNLNISSSYDQSIKVILLGESMVGKTSIIKRLCTGKLDRNFGPTIAIECHNYLVKVNNEYTIRMQIWDTVGQEKFNSIVKNYYQNSDIGIYVYSIDNLQSFNRIIDWMSNVEENNTKSENNQMKCILLGNKKDLDDEKRKISYSQAEDFAKENNFFIFKEISCKDNDEDEINNLIDVFDEIAKVFYEDFKQRRSSNLSDSLKYVASNSMMEIMEISKKRKNKKNKKKKCC